MESVTHCNTRTVSDGKGGVSFTQMVTEEARNLSNYSPVGVLSDAARFACTRGWRNFHRQNETFPSIRVCGADPRDSYLSFGRFIGDPLMSPIYSLPVFVSLSLPLCLPHEDDKLAARI